MLNKWFGMGRITKDLEKKTTPSGVSVLNFTIAVEDDYKPKDGSERGVAFVDCVAWRSTADFLEKYSGKGRMIVVTGAWKPEKWQDKDGNNRTSWKVQVDSVYFADSKRSDDSAPTNTGYAEMPSEGVKTADTAFANIVDAAGSDLPF